MNRFSLILLLVPAFLATITKQMKFTKSRFVTPQSSKLNFRSATPLKNRFNKYLSGFGSEIFNDISKKSAERASVVPARARKLKLTTTKYANQFKAPKDRRLSYESLTNSALMGGSDESSTTNQLSLLLQEQRNLSIIKQSDVMITDIQKELDISQLEIDRKLNEMSVGLERRNMLLGHYNMMSQNQGNAQNPLIAASTMANGMAGNGML